VTEIRLNDGSKLVFTWTRPGCLSIEEWAHIGPVPSHGHGWLLRGAALLEGDELESFIDALLEPEFKPAA
jgi:hypothetical protein